MLLHLFLTNFLTFVVACGVGIFAEHYDMPKLDIIATWVIGISLGLFIIFGYYAIWQL